MGACLDKLTAAASHHCNTGTGLDTEAHPLAPNVVVEEVAIGEDAFVDGEMVAFDAASVGDKMDPSHAMQITIDRPCTILCGPSMDVLCIAGERAPQGARVIATMALQKSTADGPLAEEKEVTADGHKTVSNGAEGRRLSTVCVMEKVTTHALRKEHLSTIDDSAKQRRLSALIMDGGIKYMQPVTPQMTDNGCGAHV